MIEFETVSAETLSAVGLPQPDWRHANVDVRGRDAPVSVFLIDRLDQMAAIREFGSPKQ